jgi:hypothetical protein
MLTISSADPISPVEVKWTRMEVSASVSAEKRPIWWDGGKSNETKLMKLPYCDSATTGYGSGQASWTAARTEE